ncbi:MULTISPECIES: hypothetical protein [unclassified Rhizobium]|uniref:hypothetical protein n=1 Tax=unclassified Rhizobium TaxID=2613769 RepID=UPI0012E3805F|nr:MULTISPECIES: hypothetical protein [unclassified Rhizobium]
MVDRDVRGALDDRRRRPPTWKARTATGTVAPVLAMVGIVIVILIVSTARAIGNHAGRFATAAARVFIDVDILCCIELLGSM